MSTQSAAPVRSALLPLVVLLVLTILGYAWFLVQVGEELNYQAKALVPAWYMYKPFIVTRVIAEGGYIGTLAAVLSNVVHALIFCSIAYSAAALLLGRAYKARNQSTSVEHSLQPEARELAAGVYDCDIPGSSLMVVIPDSSDPATNQVISGVKDTSPFAQVYLRCDRKPVVTSRPPTTPIEKLQVAVLELLKAHRSVPADISHHHADASLADHSIAISNKLVEHMSTKGWHEPLARLVGLAHDLDKLLAYQEKAPGVWIKRKDATHHNHYSAYLVQQQPEFAELDEDDRYTLSIVLRYYHHPSMVPKNASDRIEHLISALRVVDGQVIQAEKAAGIVNAQAGSETQQTVISALEKFLAAADINGHRGGQNAAGWTKEAFEYVIIPMSGLIERVGEFLPPQLARQLQLNVDSRNFNHPAVPVFRDALLEMRLLMTTVKAVETPTGMYDVRVGIKDWKACVLLDKDRIAEMLPVTVPKWGATQHGAIRIKGPSLDKKDPGHSTLADAQP